MTDTVTPPEIGACVLEDLADEEGVRKLIECPICLEIPLPPIYLCAKGHIVCNSCQARTYSCPLCRERYCNTRSFVAEGIVEKCNLRCRYAEGGCKVQMKGSDMTEHLLACEYRPVKCRECGDKMVNFADYEQHLFDHHKLCGTVGSEAYVAYRINMSFMERNLDFLADTCFWPQYYIKAFDKIFLLRLYAYQYTINPYVCLLGAQPECDKFMVLIEYEPFNDGKTVLSWRGPVNHFRDEPLDIITAGKCLSVLIDTIMDCGQISTERAEWIYHVTIYETPTEIPPLPSSPEMTGMSTSAGVGDSENSLEVEDAKQEGEGAELVKNKTKPVKEPNKKKEKKGEGVQEISVSSVPSSPVGASALPSAGLPPPPNYRSLDELVSPDRNKGASNSSRAGAGATTSGAQPRPSLSLPLKSPDNRNKSKVTIQPRFRRRESSGLESAGNQGDVEEYSDYDWEP